MIGTGGIGIYMVQHAQNAGAVVIAMDIDEKKLERVRQQGAHHTLLTQGLSEVEIKEKVRSLVKENKLPRYRWKVFETSGTSAGQRLAYSLLSFAGTLGIIGFTMEKFELRLSNIMAFDADVFGSWGCRPALYSEVVQNVLQKKINIRDNIEEVSLDSINEIIALAQNHHLDKRAIFVPEKM